MSKHVRTLEFTRFSLNNLLKLFKNDLPYILFLCLCNVFFAYIKQTFNRVSIARAVFGQFY